jgi:hypothetical protein
VWRTGHAESREITVAKKYYWTKTEETPEVYHDNPDCSEGKKILQVNRDESDTKPAGRDHCEVC